jgi:hypothetical protein
MNQPIRLSSGNITNHDDITVTLIEPTDGTPALVRVLWPLRPTTVATTHYPAVAATIVGTTQGERTMSNDLKAFVLSAGGLFTVAGAALLMLLAVLS